MDAKATEAVGTAAGRVSEAGALRISYFEDLEVGMSAELTRAVTAHDIQAFADVSGDYNPVHLDEDYASGTMFKACIAHGILSASYVSALFAMKLPGPGCIYVSQTLNFKAPVYIGDEVTARVEIQMLIPKRKRAIFACTCSVGDKLVLDGEAVVMVPNRPEACASS